jgi:hypothetical protein
MSYSGDEGKLYYVAESEYGVIPDTPAMTGVTFENLEPQIDASNIKVRGSGTRDLISIIKGLRKVGLKVDYVVPSDDVLAFLQHVLLLDSQTVEVIYEKPDKLVDLRLTGCLLDKATVQCSIEDVIRASVELIGQDLDPQAEKIADAEYTDLGGAVPWSDSYVSRGDPDGTGQTVTEEATDWKFTIENNLKRVPVIRNTNGYLLKYLQERQRSITGELTFEFEGKGAFDNVVGDTEFSVKLGIGPNWAPKYVLLKYCKWDSVTAPTKIEDLISLKLPFTARQIEFEGVEA